MSRTLEQVVARGNPRYSVGRAILGRHISDIDDGLEREVSGELLRGAQSLSAFRPHGGLLIPPPALFATLTTTGVQSGKELVFRRSVGVVPARHPVPQLARLGATFLFDVRDLVGLTWIGSGYQVVWQASELPSPVTATDFVLGSDQPAASSGAIRTVITRRLAVQSSPSVEELIENDIAAAIAAAIDYAGVSGSGVGQPQGLLHRGLKTVSAPLTYDAVTAGEHWVASKNEPARDTGWLGSVGARRVLRTVYAGTGGASVWALDDTIMGRAAGASTSVTPDALIHGVFPHLLIAVHAIELISDPYTRIGQGEIVITAFITLSVALAHPDNWIVFDGFTVPPLP